MCVCKRERETDSKVRDPVPSITPGSHRYTPYYMSMQDPGDPPTGLDPILPGYTSWDKALNPIPGRYRAIFTGLPVV